MAGNAVNFGPDGTVFDVPVTISVPVHSPTDLTNHILRVFRYHPASKTTPESWTEMAMPEGYEVPDRPTSIKCVTTSFSVYVAVKVPIDTAQPEGQAPTAVSPVATDGEPSPLLLCHLSVSSALLICHVLFACSYSSVFVRVQLSIRFRSIILACIS